MAKLPKTDKNNSLCACPRCPSYNDCALKGKEALYCADEMGKSACDYQKNGCICGICPIHEEYQLKTGYYCIRGAALTADNVK